MVGSGKVSCPGVGAGRSRSLQRRLHEKEGEAAWAGLVLAVLLYDMYAIRKGKETMSICWGRWLQKPSSRKVCVALWAALTSHLFISTPLPFQSRFQALARWKLVPYSPSKEVRVDLSSLPVTSLVP